MEKIIKTIPSVYVEKMHQELDKIFGNGEKLLNIVFLLEEKYRYSNYEIRFIDVLSGKIERAFNMQGLLNKYGILLPSISYEIGVSRYFLMMLFEYIPFDEHDAHNAYNNNRIESYNKYYPEHMRKLIPTNKYIRTDSDGNIFVMGSDDDGETFYNILEVIPHGDLPVLEFWKEFDISECSFIKEEEIYYISKTPYIDHNGFSLIIYDNDFNEIGFNRLNHISKKAMTQVGELYDLSKSNIINDKYPFIKRFYSVHERGFCFKKEGNLLSLYSLKTIEGRKQLIRTGFANLKTKL